MTTVDTLDAVGAARTPKAPLTRLIRSEVRWAFHRPRTLVLLGLFALIPVVIGIGIVVWADSNSPGDGGEDGGLMAFVAGNGLLLPLAALSLALTLLLPLAAAVAAADAVAGEAAAGTLRGLLLAPIGRARLLAVKAVGVAVVIGAAVLLIAVVGVIAGLALMGMDGMITLSGTTVSIGDGLLRILVAAVWVTLQLLGVAAIALAVSTLTEHPLVVVAITLGGIMVVTLLAQIPALDWLHPVLLPTGWGSLADLVRDPVPTSDLTESAWRAAAYILIGYSAALARITVKEG